MKRNVRFSLLLLALFMALSCFASCGDNPPEKDPTGTSAVAGGTKPAGTGNATTGDGAVPEYVYPELDCGGEVIRFRNLSWLWEMYIHLDADNTGDKLDREVYDRNVGIEERFKCDIEVNVFQWNWDMSEYINNIANSLQADLDSWDVVYIPLNERPALITMGYFHDLKNISGLQLDNPWWDIELNNTFELSGKLYFASSPLQLQAFDSAWALFFNETLIKNHEGMQDPRDLFADDEWTIAKLDEMCLEGANVNSAPSFYYGGGDGGQVYGLAAHPLLPDKLLYAAGERYVVKDETTGIPQFRAGEESFDTVVKKLANLLGAEHNLHASSNDMVPSENAYWGETGGYVYVFVNNRAFFTAAEVKTSRVIKSQDVEISYGIVPLPKEDSSQKEYYTPVVETMLTLTIPITCSKVDMVAKIVDAMCYDSYKNVLPVYYDQLLYRGYTDKDEPIMEVLRASRGVDMAYYYGWNDALASAVQERIFDGSAEIASSIGSEKEAIEGEITKWLNALSKM